MEKIPDECEGSYGQSTPWGEPDSVEKIAEGIYHISTPSHGGYWVDNKRYAEMPDSLKACSFTNDHFFEEDCAWVAVCLAWPDLFPVDARTTAALIYNRHYREKERRHGS